MIRTVLHTVGAALFGALYVATWTAVHIGSISAPTAGSGPSAFSPRGKGPTHEVRHAPTQRRHLPAPKIYPLCPGAPPPAGNVTLEPPKYFTTSIISETAASPVPSALHAGRAPPLS